MNATSVKRKLRNLTLVGLAAVVAACSSTSSRSGTNAPGISSSGVSVPTASGASSAQPSGQAGDPQAEAKALVDKLTAPVDFKPKGEKYTPNLAALKGKTVYFMANDLTVQYWADQVAPYKEAAKVLGVNLVIVNEAGKPSEGARLVQQAIAQKAVAIIVGAVPTELISGPLKAATDAGIKVIQSSYDGLTPADKAAGVFSDNAQSCTECVGRGMADLAVAALGTKVNAMFVNVPEVGKSVADMFNGFKTELERLCPTCKVTTRDAPLAQWATVLPAIAAAAAADTSINLLVPVFDAMVAQMRPALEAAARKIPIISYNAILPVMQMLQKGDLILGDWGTGSTAAPWFMMDQVLRSVSGAAPAEGLYAPNRLFTADNINQVDLSKPQTSWYSDIDVESFYKSLWGVS